MSATGGFIGARARVLTCLLGAALLAGCAASGAPGEDESRPSTAGQSPPGDEPSAEEAMLDYFAAGDDGDPSVEVRRFQEAVARCMQDKGFEYIPDVPPIARDDGSAPATEEWYRQWGFGISIDSSQAYGADASTERDDPNAEYVAALTDRGREEYLAALEGTLEEAEDPDDQEDRTGCYVRAGEELADLAVFEESPALVQQLQEEIASLVPVRVASDSRMRAAADELVACVVDAGGTAYDPLAGESAYEQVSRAYAQLTADGSPDAESLASFQDWERGIAAAEYRCSAPVLEVSNIIRGEVVREVVGPYLDQLQSLRDERESTG